MKTYLDCYPCIIRQALDTIRLSTDDEALQKTTMNKAMAILSGSSLNLSPPQISYYIYKELKRITGCDDPYNEIKKKYNRIALEMSRKLRKTIKYSKDPLMMAARIAIAGNIIDFGANSKFDLDAALKDSLENDFAINDYHAFLNSLCDSHSILYLGDNAGEIVFDKLLIETMNSKHKHEIIYVVKGEPVINDATLEDAMETGMADVATVITNGSGAPGTILNECSPEFLEAYKSAQMIIAKGQGNYETLSETKNEKIFFLLKVKCQLIARHIGVAEGCMVLKRGNRRCE